MRSRARSRGCAACAGRRLRSPICTVRGRKRTRRRRRSPASWSPTAEPDACSASRSGRRTARRIAGSAASGGASKPGQRADEQHARVDAEAGVEPQNVDPKAPVSSVREHDPERDPEDGCDRAEQQRGLQIDGRDLPAAPAERSHDRDLGRSARRRACVIVFEISTSADSSASSVITSKNFANWSNADLPGQSPGARTVGSSRSRLKPGRRPAGGEPPRPFARTAAGCVSASRNASASKPRTPLNEATVSVVA